MNHYSSPSRQRGAYIPSTDKPLVGWRLALLGLFLGGAATAWVFWWLITSALDRFQP
jgi:hypothetical protein